MPDEWIDRVFAVMALAPQHEFQVLTKRAVRLRAYLDADPDTLRDRWYRTVPAGKWYVSVTEAYAGIHPHASDETRALHHREALMWPLPNVWLGISAEDQAGADARIPDLLETPATIRFISAEPLLGSVDLSAWPGRLDWIIVGGESGLNARPMHTDWVRSLRDQCAAAGTAFFFKQWGEWAPADDFPSEIQEDFDVRGLTSGFSIRVGKRAAGRIFDGREYLDLSSFVTTGAPQRRLSSWRRPSKKTRPPLSRPCDAHIGATRKSRYVTCWKDGAASDTQARLFHKLVMSHSILRASIRENKDGSNPC